MGDGGTGSASQFVLPVMLALVPIAAFVVVMVIVRLFVSPARKARLIEQENIAAIKENNELLRELIALNRRILERQERP